MTAPESTNGGRANGRVVVGIDDSEGARQALRYAGEIAKWRGWTLHVVCAWHIIYPMGPYAVGLAELDAAMQESTEEMVNKILDEELGPDVELEIEQTICEGVPSQILLAASEGADLLVVGSRGRGGFASLALGSVSQACVHHATCPVLVVRPRSGVAAA